VASLDVVSAFARGSPATVLERGGRTPDLPDGVAFRNPRVTDIAFAVT
jgi:hypothetical protein